MSNGYSLKRFGLGKTLPYKCWRAFIKKMKRNERRQLQAKERDASQPCEADNTVQERLKLEEEQQKIREELDKKERENQHQLWQLKEKQAQLEFQRKREWEEKEKKKREREEFLIRQEWEEKVKKELEKEDKKKKEEEEKEEKRKKQAKLLKEAERVRFGDGEWHMPIAPSGKVLEREKCIFFQKVGACRFGERCSREHAKPESSTTLLIPGLYSHFALDQGLRDEFDTDLSLEYEDSEQYQHFLEFYEDVLPEFRAHGKVVQFKVCANYEPHLRGNVYVQYSTEEEASSAFMKFNGRWYAGKQLSCQLSVVERWKNAICGLFYQKKCPKGKNCNFIHAFKNPNNEFAEADRDYRPPRENRQRYKRWSRSPDDRRSRSRRSRSPEDRHRSRRRSRTPERYSESRSRRRDRWADSRERSRSPDDRSKPSSNRARRSPEKERSWSPEERMSREKVLSERNQNWSPDEQQGSPDRKRSREPSSGHRSSKSHSSNHSSRHSQTPDKQYRSYKRRRSRSSERSNRSRSRSPDSKRSFRRSKSPILPSSRSARSRSPSSRPQPPRRNQPAEETNKAASNEEIGILKMTLPSPERAEATTKSWNQFKKSHNPKDGKTDTSINSDSIEDHNKEPSEKHPKKAKSEGKKKKKHKRKKDLLEEEKSEELIDDLHHSDSGNTAESSQKHEKIHSEKSKSKKAKKKLKTAMEKEKQSHDHKESETVVINDEHLDIATALIEQSLR